MINCLKKEIKGHSHDSKLVNNRSEREATSSVIESRLQTGGLKERLSFDSQEWRGNVSWEVVPKRVRTQLSPILETYRFF